jgi:geranylgeranyl pyrophosphate synthase
MRNAAIGGGKRLRPLLACASADLFAVPREMSLRAGLAVECIHVHSLIHDDLPCMDDDDLRRGKPTVHVAFDEATAVLKAFEAAPPRPDPWELYGQRDFRFYGAYREQVRRAVLK